MKKEVVKLIVMVLTAMTTALTAMYLQGCSGLKVQCKGEYCITKE